MFQERTLTCRDCGQDFAFTVSEQQFFAEKGFTNDPSRCPECRAVRKQRQSRNRYGGGYRQERREAYPAVCASCGQETTVPFQPREDKPVYCQDCYRRRISNY
ncbi:MAG TPA: zinc-ribbon domain containing protein [Bacillota bacterium]|nr:zinc-ribbon domain containing protein [Bacillota bacterium]